MNMNIEELHTKVQHVYHKVATEPEGKYHFEMGRPLAERLGYLATDLDRIPSEAIASFAGVGYYFGLANLQARETVIDLGSGSGMDSFLAALKVSSEGKVTGIDMTDAQLEKAESLRKQEGITNLSFTKGFIENLPFEDASADVVISNGVINLIADKQKVFSEIFRVLKPGGRMAISDIVTERQLTENITCNISLWAACIGGAPQELSYREIIEQAGLKIKVYQENPQYKFLSKSALGASEEFGVKSISLLAVKE